MRLQSAPCGYLAIDDERRIAFLNDEAERLLGHDASELLGRSVSVVLPPASRILFHTHVYPTLADGRRVQELYTLLRRKTGETLPVLMAAARDERDGRALTECVFLAVRRRSLFERHLQQLETLGGEPKNQEGKEAVERMLTLGMLLAGVVHEVQNPLSFVLGNLQLLREELDPSQLGNLDHQVVRECVADAQAGASRILELVHAVGTLSHVGTVPPHAVDVGQVVETAAKLVRYRLTQAATLELEGPRPGPVVTADEGRLAQVVMNLLINAGQALDVSPPEHPAIRVRYGTVERDVIIDVADNGPGVPEALRDRIFKPFYTTKPVGEGTGLGLALSREIIASFHGQLELASSTGGVGATFRISLPLAAGA